MHLVYNDTKGEFEEIVPIYLDRKNSLAFFVNEFIKEKYDLRIRKKMLPIIEKVNKDSIAQYGVVAPIDRYWLIERFEEKDMWDEKNNRVCYLFYNPESDGYQFASKGIDSLWNLKEAHFVLFEMLMVEKGQLLTLDVLRAIQAETNKAFDSLLN